MTDKTDSKERDAEAAETWLRDRYGAYRGHFAWRELEEAFLAGRASLAVSAGSGPLMGKPQEMPDLSALTERGAKAWAGVDAQGLREGAASAGSDPVAQLAAERDELFQAAIDFIRTLTGMEPPPIEVAPPEVFAPFHAFVNTVQAITNKRNSPPREGMVMVPKEPTHHMLNAAASAYEDARQSLGAYNAPWAAYRAMLEVAAQPTTSAGSGKGD